MKPKYLKIVAASCATIWALSGCQEHIDEGARFTFTGNTIASYLQSEEREGNFSHFVDILSRGEALGLMKAYGGYTCFAPTNKAIERFLFEQDSIYWASVETGDTIDTGIYTPYVADLSDAMCREIAQNHILPKVLLGPDFKGSSIPVPNMNGRDLTLDIRREGDEPVVLINSEAKILLEVEVENGVVHEVEGVVSPSSLNIASQLADYDDYLSLFSEALVKTGYAERLNKIEDENYTEGDKYAKGIYPNSPDAPYPTLRRLGFTIFVETDDVFEEKGVITSEDTTLSQKFTALKQYCQEEYPENMKVWDWTGTLYEEVDHSAPLTDWHNPVNQFVGYHIVDRKVSYKNLVCYGIEESIFNSEEDFPDDADRTEYYVTMNNRILKVTMPRNDKVEKSSNIGKIFLNYAPNDEGQNILVYDPNRFKSLDERYSDYNPEARNGVLNVIDDVLVYDEDIMVGKVLYCIMRFDASSLFSELTNNNIRWKITGNASSSDKEVYIPHKYCDHIQVYSDATRLFYLSPHHAWHNYQGDEMMALGLFDFAYRLPPVPAGTYEIRMGYSASGARHVVQFFLDKDVTGLPLDLRITGDQPKINWESDKDLKDIGGEEAIIAKDKDMKNRGYLKAPSTFYDETKGGLARDNKIMIRSVIATKYLTDAPHWLRFKNVNDQDDGNAQFMHDYFEIVPTSYLRDEKVSVEEKRK